MLIYNCQDLRACIKTEVTYRNADEAELRLQIFQLLLF